MRKPKYDKDLMPTTADTAVLMFNRPDELYGLAISLNEIYGLGFVRDDDLMVSTGRGPIVCPCYTWTDDLRQLFYVLIGNPIFSGGLGGRMNYYHAILMINGDYAWDCQRKMYNDIYGNVPVPPEYDWKGQQCYSALQSLRSSVAQIDYFDFRNEAAPVSSVYANFSAKVTDRINSYFHELDICLKTIIWAIGETPDNDYLQNAN